MKKRRKKSTYIGKLSRDGLIEKKEKRVTVKQYGNVVLLQEAMKDVLPSLKVFESWEEIYALALVRVMGYVPLKRVKAVWEKLYNEGFIAQPGRIRQGRAECCLQPVDDGGELCL